MADEKPTPEEKAQADQQVEKAFGDGDAAQDAKELESELGALEMDAETLDNPTLTAQIAAEETVVAEQAAPTQQATAPDQTAQQPKPATPPRPKTPADDAAVPPADQRAQSREKARAQKEIDRLGRDRAFKVYSWLGFIGGAFAVAWGFMILFGVDTGSAASFRGDFYTVAYEAITQIGFVLKLGFFGLLEAVGLGLMGGFGRRLLRDESREQRLLRGKRHHHR